MKANLLPTGLNWYRANLHSHSTLSDGKWTPERLRDEYRRAGYSILAITDHNVLADHSDLNLPDFLLLTSTEYDIMDVDHPLPMLGSAANPTLVRYLNTIHLNLFSKTPHPADRPARRSIWGVHHNCFDGTEEEKARFSAYSRDAVNEVIRQANEAGFLVQYNHPNWSRNVREDWLALRGVWSLEILNYATEMLTGGEYCPYVYDDMLSYVDPGLFCSMGDDNHNRDDSDRQSFGGSTFIAAPELTYDAVIRAMERGDFYCASGRENPPRILGLWREDDVVEIECTPATNIFFVGEGRRYGVLRGDDLTHGTFKLDPNDTWFRLAVRDRFGNTAHTHAYPARSAG